ncbi:hypothetical protein [Streptomyces brasiliensis]|uniref:Uncharacterized protein n=1 Tax=Streptomyces brasiliensis TaxID=1954 RepID=A0A917L9A6_9ACTN|nr:hypothetical protein [Streptomyces brasiliensis]GGJ53106.1 hypothetical protein GCM10010121_074890 [Streptomyces brasiliensis]
MLARHEIGDERFSALGWGSVILIAALAPGLPLEYVTLAFVGYGAITFNSLAKTQGWEVKNLVVGVEAGRGQQARA